MGREREKERGLFLRWRNLRREDGGGEVWKSKLKRRKKKKKREIGNMKG